MIRLTDRLQIIADEIDKDETMADIGTDHGFLPISLWEKGICPKVIMADISPGSLDKARRAARELYPQQEFDLRLGNGIQVLENGEVDVVVLAGMGGILMTEILGYDLKKSRSFNSLILQPRSGQGRLRHWLIQNGFGIIKESLVWERKYICEVLTVCPTMEVSAISDKISGCDETSVEYEVPPWIMTAGALAVPFVKNKLSVEEAILNGLSKSKVFQKEKIEFTKRRIAYLKSLLGGV